MNNTSIIICCAGMGTRLGISSTKALVNISGKPLIIHLLEQLDEYDDVRIVVGYQADKVIDAVNKYRRDILFAFNYDYKTTGTIESVSKAIIGAREYTVILGGDMFVEPNGLKKYLSFDGECLGCMPIRSTEPVYVSTDGKNMAVGLSRESGDFEWSGLVKMKTERFHTGDSYVYEMLNPLLPMKMIHVRSIDIDTPEDYELADMWVRNDYKDGIL